MCRIPQSRIPTDLATIEKQSVQLFAIYIGKNRRRIGKLRRQDGGLQRFRDASGDSGSPREIIVYSRSDRSAEFRRNSACNYDNGDRSRVT